MKSSTLSAGILLLSFATGASQLAAASVEIAGLGASRCSEFIKFTENKNSANAAAYYAWAQGFMSSLNMTRAQRNLSIKALGDKSYSYDQQFAYLLSFCKRNVARDFAASAIDLYRHLPVKR